ncbi:MAG: hypothetical protein AMXMBFR84_38330 [Candidatus Hydrogenedentota bacterium]
MIALEHGIIRSSEPDDAYALWQLYDMSSPRSFLIGPSREIYIPTLDELREMLGRKDFLSGVFFVVENLQGDIRGCFVMRSAKMESAFAEMMLAMADESDYGQPLADEVFGFIAYGTFVEKKLNKIQTSCLTTEELYRAFLVRHGFVCDGIQRDMIYTHGRYYDLESHSLPRSRCQHLEAYKERYSALATS